MRSLLIIACACAAAHAQYSNTGFQSFGSSRNQGSQFGQQQGFGQSSRQQTGQTSRQQGFGNQAYNQPQQNTFGFQQQTNAPRTQSAGSCREGNGRSPVSGSCDRYIECVNGTSEEKLCPDGLHFNPNINGYPCQYPNEAPCLERSALQPAQPTEDCPHQFAYVKLGDTSSCSHFRNCVNGMAFDFECPEGLAFNSETYRCDWPDQVADCDAEAFLGFRCPPIPTSKELGEPAGYRFYRSDNDCQKYFICIEGRPRLLSCGGDSAFDELTSTCVLADEVSACPNELRAVAARSREEEKQRLAKEISLQSKVSSARRF